MRPSLSVGVALVLLLTVLPVTAQDVQGPAWDMGWVTDVDPKYVVELEDDWDLTGELVVYVQNDGPAELNLALTYDYDEDGPFSFDGPDTFSVSGNTNDTFTISITGGAAEEVRSFSPNSKIELTVVGEEQVGSSTIRSQEIQADVTVPRMFRLVPEALEPTETLFAGSWVDFTLKVKNMGNTQDAIRGAEATIRSCPHLSVVGLEELEDTVVQVTADDGGNAVEFTLRLEASSSHQERTCEVSIALESEGDQTQRSSTMNVEVKAPSVDDPVVGDEDDEDTVVSDDPSLAWSGPVDLLVLLLLAFVFSRRHAGFQSFSSE